MSRKSMAATCGTSTRGYGKHMITMWAVALCLFIAYFVFSAVYGILSGMYEVKHQPREPMFLCDKHGPISKKLTIKFTDYEELYEEDGQIKSRIGDFDYCPLCFNDRMTSAEKIK